MAQVDACVVRRELAYEEKWRRFELGERKYGQQYSQVYFNRLNMMREQLKKAALQRWSSLQEDSIMERMVKAKDGEESVIVGILFKEMKLKPSILQEYAKHGAAMMPNPPRRAEKLYADESDMLILEDETGRIPLEFPEEREILKDLREEFLVSGLVVAVKGAKTKKGLFSVAGVCPVSVLPQPSPSIFEDDAYVCIVSGLCFGDETVNPLYADLLLETLKGAALADATENFKLAHVIVAGNSVCRAKDGSDKGEYLKSHKAIDRKAQDEAAFPVRELDRFLCGVASAIPLELMPGETDPVNYLLPQQAFHPCLVPDSTKFTSVHRSTNPSEFSLGGQLFLGTSGQNVDDYMSYLPPVNNPAEESVQRLDVLESMLRFGHIAPTAPDTLASYPFSMTDPFVMKEWPNLFFAGNQPSFSTKVVTEGTSSVRIITVPSFSRTREVVFVNIRTLEPQVLSIEISL